MRLGLAGVLGAVAIALVTPLPASGATEVGANGNPFSGGLSFTPAAVTVGIGDTVRWTNTDEVVPHTATERHHLWDLTGTYGEPVQDPPPGFGPGESRERRFEAGLHNYYCKVHGPGRMRGTVTVPPRLARKRVRAIRRVRLQHRSGRGRRIVRRRVVRRYIVVTWAVARPVSGQGFDVQRRRPGGAWLPLRTGTTGTRARFRVRRGAPWQVRARLRATGSLTDATDWAVARITG